MLWPNGIRQYAMFLGFENPSEWRIMVAITLSEAPLIWPMDGGHLGKAR